MINWNEVTVGETEIEGKGVPTRWCILGIDDNQVWVKRMNRQYPESIYQIFSKQFINETYNIYDPWEDVSEECRWAKSPGSNYEWVIYHNGKAVEFDNPDFKSNGRRVWKRKEGEEGRWRRA